MFNVFFIKIESNLWHEKKPTETTTSSVPKCLSLENRVFHTDTFFRRLTLRDGVVHRKLPRPKHSAAAAVIFCQSHAYSVSSGAGASSHQLLLSGKRMRVLSSDKRRISVLCSRWRQRGLLLPGWSCTLVGWFGSLASRSQRLPEPGGKS
jgi:hypothetical protein